MSSLPVNVLYYGVEAPIAERVPLRAGPLSLVFEAGDLRYIRLGTEEILRRVYVALRDHNWATIIPRLENVRIERDATAFRISYDAIHREREIDFLWRGTISGDADGAIRFAMDGEARSTFRRNRIGFCVLHPGNCAGRPFVAAKANGSTESGQFPVAISPHQPVKNLRAFRHEVLPGVEAEVQFEGDIFEMEDQRNWTDASYKTYCTPLDLPYPVEVTSGTRVRQAITLRLHGNVPNVSGEPKTLRVIVGSKPIGRLPRLGLGVASHGQPPSPSETERLRALHIAHLRVDLNLSQSDWEASLRHAATQARALGAALEVAVTLTTEAAVELAALRTAVEAIRPRVARWLIFHADERSLTSERWIQLAREALGDYDTSAALGSGTNQFFTQLNRAHPPARLLGLVCYSVNPQVHAFDNSSLVETLEAQGWTVASARAIAKGLPVAVTPVTLRMRENPDASGPQAAPSPGELPSTVDPRQMSLFGAGWTLGSIKYLAESGASSVTYYETTGWRGVMETAEGSPLPERFRSIPGAVFPLYHVFADVGEFAEGTVLPAHSSQPLAVDALALRKDGHTCLLLANLSAEPQNVTVSGLTLPSRARSLDESNAESAMRAPEEFHARRDQALMVRNGELEIVLRPYAVARLDAN